MLHTTASKSDLSLQHLQAEIERIDLRVRREVRRWQLAGQDPHDEFRGLYLSDEQAGALAARPMGRNWGQTVSLPADEAAAFAQAEAAAALHAAGLAETARRQGRPTRLAQLVDAFGLETFDLDALLVCLAPTLDLRYERLYGYLQDDVTRKLPSVNLLLDLLCGPGPQRLQMLARFADDAPLLRHRLLEWVSPPGAGRAALLNQVLLADEAIVSWLLGHYQPSDELRPHVYLSMPQPSDEDRLLAGAAWSELAAALGGEPILVLHGPDTAAQGALARCVAARQQRPLLEMHLESVVAAQQTSHPAVVLALRDATLLGAVPYLTGWDTCLVDGAPPPRLLAELTAHHQLTIVAGQAAWQPQGIERDRVLLWVEFPIPLYGQRLALWRHFVDQARPSVALELSDLAGQFALTASQIRDAVATARDLAARRDDSLQEADLFRAARAHSNPRLSSLARKIVPRYTWSDIILPTDQIAVLHEIVATVRSRPVVLDEWGVGRKLAASAGLSVLFAGPPGTGKTMAAEVIAAELHLDLYKIDLSTVVSKYIGETEKNLERIFGEAQHSNTILFFDEADAIFGKRSEVRDAHDRYANIEVSYLLQRMEAYDGVAILATNLRANLDEAFTRRLQFAVDFPFPEEEHRLRIWRTLFPPGVPRADDLDLELMARRFKLAGGNIRNIIVNAAFLAAAEGQPVTMIHMLHSTRRELQKMGRLVNESDMSL